MALVTVASLKEQALDRADMRYSNFISDDEQTKVINASAQELYDLLTSVYEDYYFTELQFQINNATPNLTLPDDFYKMRGIDQWVNSGPQGNRISVKPFQWLERNSYIFPVSNYDCILNYIPKMVPLADDADLFDGINGFEQYIVTDAARKYLIKEESDPSALMAEKAEIRSRVLGMGSNRMAGDSNRIQDVTRLDNYFMFAAPQRLLYLLQGNQVKFRVTNFYGMSYD